MSELPQSDPGRHDRGGIFDPETLDKTVIAIPLLRQLREEEQGRRAPTLHHVVLDLNFGYREGRAAGRERAGNLIAQAVQRGGAEDGQGVDEHKSGYSQQYLFATLNRQSIQELVRLDNEKSPPIRSEAPGSGTSHRTIYRIWPDFRVRALINKSIATVKADAARISFSALGDGIVWAVVDSGIDPSHPHFAKHHNLAVDSPIPHRDFTQPEGKGDPFGAPAAFRAGAGSARPGRRGRPSPAGAAAWCGAARRPHAAAPAVPRSWTLTSGRAGPAILS